MLEKLGEFWRRMSLGRRLVLVTLVLTCVGTGVVLVGWARQTPMGLLYSGLSLEEAGKIVEKLREAGVAYELKDGGTAVYVPEDRKRQLRVSMALDGLPTRGQAGYKILDEEKLGASPFTQRVNYLRAQEGELAMTLQCLEGVSSVRVHVVRPESTVFGQSEKEPSASVVLCMKQGRRPSAGYVAAVVHLVAGSIEGLKPEKVVVVDGQGDLLSSESTSEFGKTAGSFLDYKAQIEQYLAQKAEQMLCAVLGPSRASVKVDAAFDVSSTNQTKETYDPNARVVTKEEIKSKTAVEGPAGGAASAGGTTKEDTTLSEYAVTKTVEQRVDAPGKITALTVAAFVDLSAPAAADGATPPPTITLKDAEDIIRSAVGLKPADTLKVVNVPFHRGEPAATEAGAAGGNQEFLLEIAKRSSLGLLVIGALLAMKMFGSSRRKLSAVTVAPGSAPALFAQAAQSTNLLPPGEEANPEQLRKRISRALQDNPEEVKRLFLNWVESEKTEL